MYLTLKACPESPVARKRDGYLSWYEMSQSLSAVSLYLRSGKPSNDRFSWTLLPQCESPPLPANPRGGYRLLCEVWPHLAEFRSKLGKGGSRDVVVGSTMVQLSARNGDRDWVVAFRCHVLSIRVADGVNGKFDDPLGCRGKDVEIVAEVQIDRLTEEERQQQLTSLK